MAPLTLVIGNKNYSSWSLRPWLFMKHVGLEFQEILVPLDTPETREQIDRYTPSGRVPVLRHGDLRIWDSFAICEYVAELCGKGWPQPREARAVARSVRGAQAPRASRACRAGPRSPRPAARRASAAATPAATTTSSSCCR